MFQRWSEDGTFRTFPLLARRLSIVALPQLLETAELSRCTQSNAADEGTFRPRASSIIG